MYQAATAIAWGISAVGTYIEVAADLGVRLVLVGKCRVPLQQQEQIGCMMSSAGES